MIVFNNTSSAKPFIKLKEFYEKAVRSEQKIVEAACISSFSTELSEVDSRFVNIKYVQDNDLIFFSNYNSPKSQQFKTHEKISVAIFWNEINVQIRMKGLIKKSDKKISDKHFKNRSDKKNALAIASSQSKKIDSYESFIELYDSTLKNADLSQRPKYWGGFSFTPFYFEFWEGNAYRINKRISYKKVNDEWISFFLQP